MTVGLERVTDPRGYVVDGRRRGGNPLHPFVVLQITLDGRGSYESRTHRFDLEAGSIFTAVVPGDHVYRLPAVSPAWSFFWLITSHDEFVRRAIEREALAGPVLVPGLSSPLVSRLADLFEGVCHGRFVDEHAWEEKLLGSMCEYDRLARRTVYPPQPREQLLEFVRDEVTRNLSRAIDVAELAERRGASRSGFTHHFRAVTGLTPAHYVTEVRLAEVRKRLADGDEPLKAIALATGFANANHLGKVFRRHHAMTPADYRRQIRRA